MYSSKLPGDRKKILFASFPADGHFNPLTGLAVHLSLTGYDVRWYTSSGYAKKLAKLNIPHYPFKKAIDVSDNNFDQFFPGREKKKTQIGKLKFDIINAFILRGPEYYEDIKAIHASFPFDLMIADCAFTGIPFVKERMRIPVISIGVMPLTETSKDLPPAGLAMTPSYTALGKLLQSVLRAAANMIIFKQPHRVMYQLFEKYQLPHKGESLFDMNIQKSDLFLQIGTPGFEYYRSDLSRHIRFIGPLLPHATTTVHKQWFDPRLVEYKKMILVTQGTVEKDPRKLLIPTLEAFKDTEVLLVVTTGGSQTTELRESYPHKNIIIEDYIPFAEVMPYADAYITNGGYGGVMLGVEHKLPMVVAGVHEGKNEICARVGYFKLGINLKTETPSPRQIKLAVEKILSDNSYKINVEKLEKEFTEYDPFELSSQYIAAVLKTAKTAAAVLKMEMV